MKNHHDYFGIMIFFHKITRGRGRESEQMLKTLNARVYRTEILVKICHTKMHLRFFAPTILQMVDAKNVHRLI